MKFTYWYDALVFRTYGQWDTLQRLNKSTLKLYAEFVFLAIRNHVLVHHSSYHARPGNGLLHLISPKRHVHPGVRNVN